MSLWLRTVLCLIVLSNNYVNCLNDNYVGHCSLSEVFQELVCFLSTTDRLAQQFTI